MCMCQKYYFIWYETIVTNMNGFRYRGTTHLAPWYPTWSRGTHLCVPQSSLAHTTYSICYGTLLHIRSPACERSLSGRLIRGVPE